MVSVDFATLAWIVAIPTSTMLFGMLLVQFWSPGAKLTALLQHFAAGVVFCAIAAEVLPELLSPSVNTGWDYLGMLIGFVVGMPTCLLFCKHLGVVSMLLIARIAPDHEAAENKVVFLLNFHNNTQKELRREQVIKELQSLTLSQSLALSVNSMLGGIGQGNVVNAKNESHNPENPAEHPAENPTESDPLVKAPGGCLQTCKKLPWGLIVPVATDATMDGLLIGIAFVAGSVPSGVVMALALAIEMCFLGISTSAMMQKKAVPRFIALPICSIIPFFIMGAGFLGSTILILLVFLALAWQVQSFCLLSFSLKLEALLFLVSDELLVEAHRDENTDTWWITIFFFIGFGVVVLLQKFAETLEGTSSSSSAEHSFNSTSS